MELFRISSREDKIELFIKGIDQNSANQTLVDLVESNFKN